MEKSSFLLWGKLKKGIGQKMEKSSFLLWGKLKKRPLVKKWKKVHFYFGGNLKKGYWSKNGKKLIFTLWEILRKKLLNFIKNAYIKRNL